MELLYVLITFMIIAALVAVELADLISSVIALGAVGLGLVLAFLFLQAPELAIIQLVIEILALIILIRATVSHDRTKDGRKETFIYIGFGVFVIAFLATIYTLLTQFPEFGSSVLNVSKVYVENGTREGGNTVNSILLDYRSVDTLAALSVLTASVIGVLAVVRRTGRTRK